MARPKTFTELEEATSFFPAGSSMMVQRLIARATKREIAANRRAMKAAVSGNRGAQKFGQAASRLVARELSKALKQRGASKRQAPSVKQKAPDTGGRPFHFAHSAISKTTPKAGKGGGPPPGAGAADGGASVRPTGKASAGSGSKATTKSAAHMRYIERETAVEVTRGPGGPGVDQAIEAAVAAEVGVEGGRERTPGIEEASRSSGAGQGYIENPVKLANGESVIFSFGTIGDTFDERVAFWETLEEHERNENGRVQDRLIVELPHEASPEARHDMVKAFCGLFEELGLPYWAALHAPGADNDKRNFHAHIVYSSRPARRMTDPADGVEKWDFAIVESYKTSSRHTRVRYPHRQKRAPEMERSDAIRKMRARFAAMVNAVLIRDDVKAKDGTAVRYDARSYRAMGLDVVPMRSINRIVADKLKGGRLTVLDRDYTRKMIEAELREARGRRDRRLTELDKLGRAIDGIRRDPRAKDARKGLPKELRPSPLAKVGTKVIAKVGEQLLATRYAAYVHDVMEQSSRSTLDRIVEATDPKVVAESAKATKDPVKRAALPDVALAAALHAEALEMRDRFERDNVREKERLRLRMGQAMNRWVKAVAAPAPEASPTVKRERRRVMSRAEAERAIRSTRADGPTKDGMQRNEVAREATSSHPTGSERARPVATEAKGKVAKDGLTKAASTAQVRERTDEAGGRVVTKAEYRASDPVAKGGDAHQVSAHISRRPAASDAREAFGQRADAKIKTPGVISSSQARAGQPSADEPGRPAARPTMTEKERAEVRRRFDTVTSGIMKAMRGLRSIPDVEKRMAAMDELAKVPLGPMDDSMRRIVEEAWSVAPGRAAPADTGNAGSEILSDRTPPVVPTAGQTDAFVDAANAVRSGSDVPHVAERGTSESRAASTPSAGSTTRTASKLDDDETEARGATPDPRLSPSRHHPTSDVGRALDASSPGPRGEPAIARSEDAPAGLATGGGARDEVLSLPGSDVPVRRVVSSQTIANGGAASLLGEVVVLANAAVGREGFAFAIEGATRPETTQRADDPDGSAENPKQLAAEEEAKALHLGDAKRAKKRRKVLLSKGRRKEGWSR